MQLLVLNENFEIIGPVDLYTTLMWTRRFQSLGAFELYTSKRYFPILNEGRYLYRNDRTELGVIDQITYDQENNSAVSICAKGNFAEGLLAQRVIEKTQILSGNLETVMRALVTDYAISPTDAGRVIDHLQLGNLSGLTATVNSQITGENLSDELFALGNAENYSHRIRYDYLTDKLFFEVWRGKDRRQSQTENSWAIFSNSFKNVKSLNYERDNSAYKNFAYVAGEENEDGTRTIIEIDNRSAADEARRELYVDARDLQSEDEDGNTISPEEYEAQLRTRGLEKLAEYARVENVQSDIDPNANLIYMQDFDLGDWVTFIDSDIGIEEDELITEIRETYEGAAMTLTVTLGNSGVSTIRQLIKRETG